MGGLWSHVDVGGVLVKVSATGVEVTSPRKSKQAEKTPDSVLDPEATSAVAQNTTLLHGTLQAVFSSKLLQVFLRRLPVTIKG